MMQSAVGFLLAFTILYVIAQADDSPQEEAYKACIRSSLLVNSQYSEGDASHRSLDDIKMTCHRWTK